MRIVGTERADPCKQRVVVRRNFTQLRIEVFRGDVLLLQDFEKAGEGGLGDAQFFRQALKLLGGYALRLRDKNIAASIESLGI